MIKFVTFLLRDRILGDRMNIKSTLFCTTALLIAYGGAFAAAESNAVTSETSADDIADLRDLMKAQTKRLERAEKALKQQQSLLLRQQKKITKLENELEIARDVASTTSTTLAELIGNEWYDPSARDVYVVKPGDTLYSISQKMGASVAELTNINGIEAAHKIAVGQVIKGPAARPAPVQIAAVNSEPVRSKIKNPPANEPTKEKPQRVAANTNQPAPGPQRDPSIQDRAIAQQRRNEEAKSEELPQEVGIRPDDENEAPYLALFSDVAGILTPKGQLFVEPSVSFTASSDNRFFFEGVEILDAILIGAIEATDTDRIAITENVGIRYGLTNRLEIDAAIPYVYREDRVSGVAIDDMTDVDDAQFGSGLGDATFGVHYQLNKGVKWPYLVANLTAKAPTGTGPFDVERAANGQETELATGSGFWSVEPSLSFVLPSDPAVIFGSIGYQRNFATAPDETIGATVIREFRPGDAISASLGVGLSLNERLSINLGYSHRYFLQTETFTELTNVDGDIFMQRSVQAPATVGNLLFGGSYSLNDRVRLNLGTSFGATDEAPDFRTSLRLQVKLK